MKNKRYLTIVILLILALMLAASPVRASAMKTAVSGTLIWISDPYEDPDARWWLSGHLDSIYHFRYDIQEYEVITSDPRLSGWQILRVSGQWFPTFLLVQGTSVFYADNTYTTPTWECTHQGRFDEQGGVVDAVCKGVGANTGLLARYTATFPDENWNYALQGYILEPGQ